MRRFIIKVLGRAVCTNRSILEERTRPSFYEFIGGNMLSIASWHIARPCNARQAVLRGFLHRTSRFVIVNDRRAFATEQRDADPMEVFDMIDTNKDGVLSREEFASAVDMLHYDDLLKIKTSLSRNELSYNPHADHDKMIQDTGDSTFLRRLQVTAEVAVSKIFPAGFGWQTGATLLGEAGYQPTDLAFFLGTGLADGAGVCMGHFAYMASKKLVTGDPNIDLGAQFQTGFMLGSAAICSGGIWQPTVNALQDAGWSFNSSLLVTGGVATLAFFTGLRLSRIFYGPIMSGVEEPNYANLKADAGLSFAVGGAASCFLGTDVSYEAANWLRPYVGIDASASAITGSVLAGSSTALGFSVVQMGENVVYKRDECWVD